MPFEERPDVHRNIAFALLQFAGNVLERERLRFEIEQCEDAALQLVQDSGGRGGGPDTIDEDRAGPIHPSPSVLNVQNILNVLSRQLGEDTAAGRYQTSPRLEASPRFSGDLRLRR